MPVSFNTVIDMDRPNTSAIESQCEWCRESSEFVTIRVTVEILHVTYRMIPYTKDHEIDGIPPPLHTPASDHSHSDSSHGKLHTHTKHVKW